MATSTKHASCLRGDAAQIAQDLKKLVNHKDTSDLKFILGPRRSVFFAHQCILIARCEVFRAMLTNQENLKVKDGRKALVLSDTIPEVFAAMMEFIYTNCVTLNEDIAIDVLASSVEYGLDSLRDICTEYLTKNLRVETACETMQAAVTYGQDELRRNVTGFIETNTQQVFQSKSLHELSDRALAYILQSDELRMDEKDLLVAVTEWANVNAVISGKPLSLVALRVVIHIRLPLLAPDELKTVEENNNKTDLIPVEMFSYAWRYHALKGTPGAMEPSELTTPRRGTVQRDITHAMDTL